MAAMVAPPTPTTPTTPTTTPNTKTILGKYQVIRVLGRGSFAKVYLAKSITNPNTSPVAIKVISKSKTNPSMEPLIIREVEAMRRLNHPNVLRIYEVMASKTNIYLVMELAQGGDLFSKLARRPDHRFSEPLARRCFHQLVSALQFCHLNGVAHRDVKPQNLLLDEHGNIKISDFGLSAVTDPKNINPNNVTLLQTACGTPAFAAPEIVGRTRSGYDGSKADAWSCGVILFVLLTGSLPFDDTNLVLMFRRMHKREFKFPSWVSRPARALITRLLDPNPKTRFGIEQIMENSWMKNHGNVYSRSVSLGDIASLELEKKKYMGGDGEGDGEASGSMNAFEIISMSSGLDLSGMFDDANGRKQKRFTSRESKGLVAGKVVEVGMRLGYEVERRDHKGPSGSVCVVFGKEGLVLKVVMSEVAPELVVVEVKVVSASGLRWDEQEEEELHWKELVCGLGDIVVSWHQ